jgi:TatA/E family protein of Tat protein translocase
MNLGMPEMIFIVLMALVLFGPKKLPELARQLGKAMAEFKKASNEFKNQLETEMMNIELEDRAKQPPPAPSPTILPAEKLFDTVSVPPIESIPRAPLPLAAEAAAPELPSSSDSHSEASTEPAPLSPLTPDAHGQNA